MENNNNWYEQYQRYQMEQKREATAEPQPQKKTCKKISFSKIGLISFALAIAIFAGALGGVLTGLVMKPKSTSMSATSSTITYAKPISVITEAEPGVPNQTSMTQNVLTSQQVVEIAAPSVVGIDVTIPVEAGNMYGGLFDPFAGFGGFGNFGGFGKSEPYEASGAGSGVIISDDGYIVTCNHVIDGASKITVTLNDDTQYEATLIGNDVNNDLAIIKIEPEKSLISAALGDSDMVTVGEDVIAIGNHLGELRGTATAGIISAMNREISIEGTSMKVLQHDAAVSPGSSGGGLFNSSGSLIGIVNAKASDANAEGLGFAIPVNSVKKNIEDLIQYGYVKGRAYLGVATQNRSLQMDGGRHGYYDDAIGSSCVQVYQVVEGSAADKAGIKANDLIIKVGDKDIRTNEDLSSAIGSYNSGDSTEITIVRDGKELKVNVCFGEYEPEPVKEN